MLCPLHKDCTEYQTRRKYIFLEKWKCSHKEYWSKCLIYLKDQHKKQQRNSASICPDILTKKYT